MSGVPKQVVIARFAKLTEPRVYHGSMRICSLTATSVLTHAKSQMAVAECQATDTGARRMLCASCASYVQSYQWALGLGVTIGSETELLALAHVWSAPEGYTVPQVESRGGLFRHNHRAHHLARFVKAGLLKKVAGRYLLRDACPVCYRRSCGEDCPLHMGAEFWRGSRRAAVSGSRVRQESRLPG